MLLTKLKLFRAVDTAKRTYFTPGENATKFTSAKLPGDSRAMVFDDRVARSQEYVRARN